MVRTPRSNNGKYKFNVLSYEQITEGETDLNGKNKYHKLEMMMIESF